MRKFLLVLRLTRWYIVTIPLEARVLLLALEAWHGLAWLLSIHGLLTLRVVGGGVV